MSDPLLALTIILAVLCAVGFSVLIWVAINAEDTATQNKAFRYLAYAFASIAILTVLGSLVQIAAGMPFTAADMASLVVMVAVPFLAWEAPRIYKLMADMDRKDKSQ
jgi:cytochrome bd-type quinol oxidase subunit 2